MFSCDDLHTKKSKPCINKDTRNHYGISCENIHSFKLSDQNLRQAIALHALLTHLSSLLVLLF